MYLLCYLICPPQVVVVAQMVKISKSMRLYLKVGSASSLIQFSDFSEDKNDPGDGGGIPIFTFWSISYFGMSKTRNLRSSTIDDLVNSFIFLCNVYLWIFIQFFQRTSKFH